jgi:hypothetical protein
MVDDASVVSEVPVAFVKASWGKAEGAVVDVAVKKVARISPATSSLAMDVVAEAPIKT